jgi:hypothetical protein
MILEYIHNETSLRAGFFYLTIDDNIRNLAFSMKRVVTSCPMRAPMP